MKEIALICLLLVLGSSFSQSPDSVLNNWHSAATNAQYNAYFDVMEDSCVFWGTDSTEHWSKVEFMEFAKPYFDTGKTWDFKVKQRFGRYYQDSTVYVFEEELATWMGNARGSGVLIFINGKWLITQYNLSLPIPNEKMEEVIEVIARQE